eukprot:362018-Chlamydomonas_euryale.AAC.4
MQNTLGPDRVARRRCVLMRDGEVSSVKARPPLVLDDLQKGKLAWPPNPTSVSLSTSQPPPEVHPVCDPTPGTSAPIARANGRRRDAQRTCQPSVRRGTRVRRSDAACSRLGLAHKTGYTAQRRNRKGRHRAAVAAADAGSGDVACHIGSSGGGGGRAGSSRCCGGVLWGVLWLQLLAGPMHTLPLFWKNRAESVSGRGPSQPARGLAAVRLLPLADRRLFMGPPRRKALTRQAGQTGGFGVGELRGTCVPVAVHPAEPTMELQVPGRTDRQFRRRPVVVLARPQVAPFFNLLEKRGKAVTAGWFAREEPFATLRSTARERSLRPSQAKCTSLK